MKSWAFLKHWNAAKWKAFALQLWCHDLFPGTHHFGIAWFPAHSLPHHHHFENLTCLHSIKFVEIDKKKHLFVSVTQALTASYLSQYREQTPLPGTCDAIFSLTRTWNSPETSPPRWSRSESWNQNRAGSEIHWKWMVLGNPGKQARRQGRLTAIIKSQESWHASERWWLPHRNHHCLNSFPGCKRENFSRPPRKLLKTTAGFSRAD